MATPEELAAAAERAAEEALEQLKLEESSPMRRGAAVKRREKRERRRAAEARAAEAARAAAEAARAAAEAEEAAAAQRAAAEAVTRPPPLGDECGATFSECPICLETMSSPVLCLVPCGHTTCGRARCSLLTRCPVCRCVPSGSLRVFV